MDFISLYDLMDELASNTAPKYSNSEEARYSEAAADLHQWLMSSTGRPQWLKINKNTRRPVPDNNVSDKGIAMLEHMAGWEGRTHDAYCRYRSELARAEAQGIDESLILPGINQADLMYKGADYLQAMEIGFDKKEISEFIEQYAPKPEIKPDADRRTEPESVKDEMDKQADTTSNKRECQLHTLIWRVYLHLMNAKGKATAQQVWYEIQHRHREYDEEGIIQEVTADLIQWESFHRNETRFKKSSLSPTITKLKKTPPF